MLLSQTVRRSEAKIITTGFNHCFDTVIISEEVGYSKPDKHIFQLALKELQVQPEAVIFVGDDLRKDIAGCQNANMKGIWFSPHAKENTTGINHFLRTGILFNNS